MAKIHPSLKIGTHLARYPIVQGAMAVRVSGGNLAGEVANAGGVGIISSLGLGLTSPHFHSFVQKGEKSEFDVASNHELELGTSPKDTVRRSHFFAANQLALMGELHKARSISPDGIVGVNILVATKDYAVMAQTAAANGADLIITAAGLPLDLPEHTATYPDVALMPMVCGLDAVETICQTWWQRYRRFPDAFVVENSQAAGGHVGTTCETFDSKIEGLLPQIRGYLQHQLKIDIPLIAAGGVWDRSDVDRMLALGADGVQVGTRFITTEECDADRRYKAAHLAARLEDVMIVPSPVGKPARVLRNAFAQAAVTGALGLEKRCIANCLEACLCRDSRKTYCILQALARAANGDVENGLLFSGANVGRAARIMSVAEVMSELTDAPKPVYSLKLEAAQLC